MKALREAATDGLHVVVFDPAAVGRAPAAPGAAPARREVDLDDLEGWAEAGRLVIWETPGDGCFTLALFVDEPPDEALRLRAVGPLTERLLRVPGGRLTVVGAEALDLLGDPGDEPGWPDEAALVVPAGDYAVTAFEVAWDDADERAAQARLRADAGPWRVRLREAVGAAAAVLAMLTVAVAIPALVLLVARPGQFMEAVVRYGPWLLAPWLLLMGVLRLPFVAAVDAARERLERERPVAVVALRRLAPGEPRPTIGAAFGGDYAEEWG